MTDEGQGYWPLRVENDGVNSDVEFTEIDESTGVSCIGCLPTSDARDPRLVRQLSPRARWSRVCSGDSQDGRLQVRRNSSLTLPGASLDDPVPSQKLSFHAIGEELYQRLETNNLPNFLARLHLDEDGGLDRVASLWDPQKYLWFAMLLAAVVFNMVILTSSNWAIFRSFANDMYEQQSTILEHAIEDHANVTESTKSVLQTLAPSVDTSNAYSQQAQTADIFKYIKDPVQRARLLTCAAMVATFEFLWIVVYAARILADIMVFVFGASEYMAFFSLNSLFQVTLPYLATFSSIKLMGRVHPSLIYAECTDFVRESAYSRSRLGHAMVVGWFVLTRSLCGIIALGSFSVKMLAVGLQVANPDHGVVLPCMHIGALLNQCMGCVLLESLLQDRLFLFIFGGQDTDYQDEEKALRYVYQCRVVKQIWMNFWATNMKFKAIVLLATLDHYDLQRLLIDDQAMAMENEEQEKSVVEEQERSDHKVISWTEKTGTETTGTVVMET